MLAGPNLARPGKSGIILERASRTVKRARDVRVVQNCGQDLAFRLALLM